jgi:hypothetical protein
VADQLLLLTHLKANHAANPTSTTFARGRPFAVRPDAVTRVDRDHNENTVVFFADGASQLAAEEFQDVVRALGGGAGVLARAEAPEHPRSVALVGDLSVLGSLVPRDVATLLAVSADGDVLFALCQEPSGRHTGVALGDDDLLLCQEYLFDPASVRRFRTHDDAQAWLGSVGARARPLTVAVRQRRDE